MKIEVGRKYKAIGSYAHQFNDGEIVELIQDGFVLDPNNTEGVMGHFVSTERVTTFGDQVLTYGEEVEEIE